MFDSNSAIWIITTLFTLQAFGLGFIAIGIAMLKRVGSKRFTNMITRPESQVKTAAYLVISTFLRSYERILLGFNNRVRLLSALPSQPGWSTISDQSPIFKLSRNVSRSRDTYPSHGSNQFLLWSLPAQYRPSYYRWEGSSNLVFH